LEVKNENTTIHCSIPSDGGFLSAELRRTCFYDRLWRLQGGSTDIVFDSGSSSRWGGEFESLSGYVYLDFDGGIRLPDVDFNGDGSVNIADFNYFSQTWLLSNGQAGYLYICDLVNDDVIDLNDILIFLEYWLD
jgi:hypothetical protein